MQYVGETKTKLCLRFANHVSSVKTKKLYPVAIHFNNPNHSINDVEIIVIDACTSNDTHRKLRESHWIHQLKTTLWPQYQHRYQITQLPLPISRHLF